MRTLHSFQVHSCYESHSCPNNQQPHNIGALQHGGFDLKSAHTMTNSFIVPRTSEHTVDPKLGENLLVEASSSIKGDSIV